MDCQMYHRAAQYRPTGHVASDVVLDSRKGSIHGPEVVGSEGECEQVGDVARQQGGMGDDEQANQIRRQEKSAMLSEEQSGGWGAVAYLGLGSKNKGECGGGLDREMQDERETCG